MRRLILAVDEPSLTPQVLASQPVSPSMGLKGMVMGITDENRRHSLHCYLSNLGRLPTPSVTPNLEKHLEVTP